MSKRKSILGAPTVLDGSSGESAGLLAWLLYLEAPPHGPSFAMSWVPDCVWTLGELCELTDGVDPIRRTFYMTAVALGFIGDELPASLYAYEPGWSFGANARVIFDDLVASEAGR